MPTKYLSFCMATFSPSLTKLKALLPQSHEGSCGVSRWILAHRHWSTRTRFRAISRLVHFYLNTRPSSCNFSSSSFGQRHRTMYIHYILFILQHTNTTRSTKLYRTQTISDSSRTACNGQYETKILYFILKMPHFNKFGLCRSVIRGTRHPYNHNKRHNMFTIIYNCPRYNDHFLNRGTTKPYLKFNKDGTFPLRIKKLNVGESGNLEFQKHICAFFDDTAIICFSVTSCTHSSQKLRRL
jgi:hypothetical protein